MLTSLQIAKMASGLRVYIDTNICVIADAYLGLFGQSINFTVECTGGGINNLRIYGAPLQLAPNGSGSPEEDAQKMPFVEGKMY